MGLELLTMTVFWTWNSVQPCLQPAPVAVVAPTKVILQASWIEPVSMRDETSEPVVRQPANAKKTSRSVAPSRMTMKKSHKPLWEAAKSWELPPILWAGFEGFLAAGLGILSLLKK